MESGFKDKQTKSYNVMRIAYDITMSILFLGMAVIMLFADKLHIDQLTDKDNDLFRYFFGGICLLYGGFRLYRGVKRNN